MCVRRVWFCASKAKNSLGKDEGGGRVPPKSMLTLMYFLTKCTVTISMAMLSILSSHFLHGYLETIGSLTKSSGQTAFR